jgi:adenylosuccinate synthase
MPVTGEIKMSKFIVLGSQWGDEGKGKIVDMLSSKMDMVVRFQGGANAGHTIVADGKEYVLHLIPGGVISGKAVNVIGNGCVVDPIIMAEELKYLEEQEVPFSPEKLIVSAQAHMVTPIHRYLDKVLNKKIGTTGRGIGPAYADKIHRTGIRMETVLDGTCMDRFMEHADTYAQISKQVYEEEFPDIKAKAKELEEALKIIKPFIKDSIQIIKEYKDKNARVLFEGAQGTLLDVDHGSYPFVTSSSTSIGGAYTGSGVYMEFDKRIAVVKAYTTRVGEGPFPTELFDEDGEKLRKNGNEFGATTGRPRRCGWLDLVQLKRSFTVNGFNYISLSKLSVLSGFETIKVATHYSLDGTPVYKEMPGWSEDVEGITELDKLPQNCRNYIDFIENELETEVGMISTGPARNNIIFKKELF